MAFAKGFLVEKRTASGRAAGRALPITGVEFHKSVPIDVEAAIIPNLRQKLLLEDTLGSTEIICRELDNNTPVELIAIHLKEAIDSLGRIVGATAGVDVLGQIFSRFCIGK